jgi:ligand-binding SRPBCC domain-containing protein
MRLQKLERRQRIPAPPDEVFAFFGDPENLGRITPPWLRFIILTPPPIEIDKGALIDYSIRWGGLPVRWTTMITQYDSPHRFVDQQLSGPYSFWHHTHTFADRGGETEMGDTVLYSLPAGFLGRITHTLLVRRQLGEIFDYRARVIEEFFSRIGRGEVHT